MLTLDPMLRGGALAILLLLALTGLRDLRTSPLARLTLLFDGGATAYLIESAPTLHDRHAWWLLPLRLLSSMNAGFFVLWAEAAFNDGSVPRPVGILAPAAILLTATIALWLDSPLAWHVEQVTAVLLVAFGLIRTLAGRTTDLVEARRRARLLFAIALGLAVAAFTILGAIGPPGLPAVASVLVLVMAAAMLRLGTLQPPQPPAPAAPAQDRGLEARLRGLMTSDRAWREDRLSLASLAERLDVPEYRLRRLINQQLGHRNFTAFTNAWRLDEAIAALSDPTQARVPILTIALDCGFGSIGPFNRAFKARTGQTPSEFRRRVLG